MRNFFAMALLSLFVFNATVFATANEDIVPTAKFGFVRLQLPKTPAVRFGDYFFSLINTASGKITDITNEGVNFKVHSGFEYTLRIQHKSSDVIHERRGFFVGEKQEVVIGLSAVTFDLDTKALDSDFLWHPGQVVVVAVDDKATKQLRPYGNTLLLTAGEYQFTLSNVDRFLDLKPYFPKKVSLSPLQVSSLSLTPPDERATVIVQFDKQTYRSEAWQGARQSAIVLQYTNSKAVAVEDYKIPPTTGEFRKDVRVEDPKDANQIVYKLWPNLKEGGRYEIDINNMRQILAVKPRETQIVKIHSLNVDHIDGKEAGFYRVALEKETSNSDYFSWITCNGGYCYPAQTDASWMPTVDNLTSSTALSNGFFRTRTTHHVLHGYRYRVVPYAFDTLKQLKEQEPIIVDYTDKK